MYTLPKLRFPFNALEPHIDRKTMEIHHGKHHAGYVNNLNAAVEKYPKYSKMEVEDILRKLSKVPASIRKAIRNNGGGHANHSLFWKVLAPKGQSKPAGSVLKAIETKYSNVEKFKELFSKAATTQFGSGWAWLAVEKKNLNIISSSNQDTPLSKGAIPILCLDVWEHAYYLKYQNRRADYVQAWWNVVNWKEVERNFKHAT